MKTKISLLLLLIFTACSPLKVINTGYMAFIERGRIIEWEKFTTTNEVDSFVCEKTHTTLFTEELIGKDEPYYEFYNGDFSVYVQKEFICEKRNGKIVWKPYK